MVYRLNETTWLQDVGGEAEIFYFLNWAMLTIVNNTSTHVTTVDSITSLYVASGTFFQFAGISPLMKGLLRLNTWSSSREKAEKFPEES